MEVFKAAGSGAGNMGRVCVRLGRSQKISYNGAAGPGHHPASSCMLFLCGCRAVPKAKLPVQKEKQKKNHHPNSSAHPSLDRLFLQLEILSFQCSARAWTETPCALLLAHLIPEKVSLFRAKIIHRVDVT